MEDWAREREEKRLMEKVRGMDMSQRREYLHKVATFYLAEMGYAKLKLNEEEKLE